MTRTHTRLTLKLLDPSFPQIPFYVSAAVLLRQIVDLWFDGDCTRASKAFGLTHSAVHKFVGGHTRVSPSMLAKMKAMLDRSPELERQREQRERLATSERRSQIPLMKNQMERLIAEASALPNRSWRSGKASATSAANRAQRATERAQRATERAQRATERAKENGPPERTA